jgi:predicted enzyme related to lactoylglutathione lyase
MSDNAQPNYGNGKICYLELPSRDINESSSFYQTVFDWKVRQRDDGSAAFDDGVGEVSGTWRTDRKPASEIGLMVHIMVDDIEVTIQKIIEHGGTIVQPVGMDAPEITAWFRDLSGNVLGLYQHRGL